MEAAGIIEPLPAKMLFCVARTEIESWLLADTAGISSLLEISPAKMVSNVEMDIVDSKEYLVNLAKNSKNRLIRQELVPEPKSSASTGLSYNDRLSDFASNHWSPEDAKDNSISLKRAITKLTALEQ